MVGGDNIKYLEELKKILEFEEREFPKKIEYYKRHNLNLEPAWEWHEVGISPAKLRKLVEEGWLKIVYKSNKRTEYRLVDQDKVRELLQAQTVMTYRPERKHIDVNELFKYIVGYDDIKELLRSVLKSKKPVHVLLIGPPATGKTLFLEDIYNAVPDAEFVVGSEASGLGLSKLIRERQPSILLIDEIDKLLKADDLSTLLGIMESGKTRRTKGDMITDVIEVNIKVIAAGNTDKHLPPELKSRFLPPLYLKPYTYKQFRDVVINYLTNFEEVSREVAEYIADRVWEFDKDVRTARSVARLCGNNKSFIDNMFKLFRKYSKSEVVR